MSKTKEEILLTSFANQQRAVKPFPAQREVCFVAMEEYYQSQLSEYKQKLKAEIEKEEYQIPNDDFEFGWNKALEKVVLTLIDKI